MMAPAASPSGTPTDAGPRRRQTQTYPERGRNVQNGSISLWSIRSIIRMLNQDQTHLQYRGSRRHEDSSAPEIAIVRCDREEQ